MPGPNSDVHFIKHKLSTALFQHCPILFFIQLSIK